MSLGDDRENVHGGQSGRLNKLQLLQYHQAVLESQTRDWLQTQDGHEVNIFIETLKLNFAWIESPETYKVLTGVHVL